jgi:hypothetical protein
MEELGEWSRDGGENGGRGCTVDAGRSAQTHGLDLGSDAGRSAQTLYRYG